MKQEINSQEKLDELDHMRKELVHMRIAISKLHEKTKTPTNPFESDRLSELFTSLSKAQSDMEFAKTDSINPFFKSKYANLASTIKASRDHLGKNGLSIIQRVIPNGNGMMHLYTRLCHASGQWMESKMPILPPKQDIQTLGSYITYLRRYNYACMVCVVADDDKDDDDGELSMLSLRNQGISSIGNKNITKEQLYAISQELEGQEEILESLLVAFSISKLSDLPAKEYKKCFNTIREAVLKKQQR